MRQLILRVPVFNRQGRLPRKCIARDKTVELKFINMSSVAQSDHEIEIAFRKFLTSKLYLRRQEFAFTDPVSQVFELDSLNLMLIAFFLEKTYGIKLQKDDLLPGRFRTLSDFVSLVRTQTGGK